MRDGPSVGPENFHADDCISLALRQWHQHLLFALQRDLLFSLQRGWSSVPGLVSVKEARKPRWRRRSQPAKLRSGAVTESVDILCRRCGSRITSDADRVCVAGLHRHSQVNPHGFIWEFDCFANAHGCSLEHNLTLEFTWFPRFRWQLANCRQCQFHLGWHFVASKDSFGGLICDRLCRE